MQTVNSFFDNKSAMEIYYLRKQLPEMATIQKPPITPKTFDFYKDNTNIWDKTARTSKKMYEFYHKYNDLNKKNIDRQKQLGFFDEMRSQELKKQQLISEKDEDRSRLATRKLERKVLQYESRQKLDTNCENDEGLIKTLNNREVAENLLNKNIRLSSAGRVPNFWNDLTKASLKSIRMECTNSVILKDEAAIVSIQNKINKELELERVKKEMYKENREGIRNKFIQKHNTNIEFEKKVGLVPDVSPPQKEDLFKKKFINLKSRLGKDHNDHLEKLSQPKTVFFNFY